MTVLNLLLGTSLMAAMVPAAEALPEAPLKVTGHRFLTLNTVIRVNQIESGRHRNVGADEATIHTPKTVAAFRNAFTKGFPGAQVTWAFSWLALQDERPNYVAIRKQVVGYHEAYGDEITFIPGGFFAPMYNSRAQVNQDLKEALQRVRDMVGHGYRPMAPGLVWAFSASARHRFTLMKCTSCQTQAACRPSSDRAERPPAFFIAWLRTRRPLRTAAV